MPADVGLMVTSKKEAENLLDSLTYFGEGAEDLISKEKYSDLSYLFRFFLKKYQQILSTQDMRRILWENPARGAKCVSNLISVQEKIQTLVRLGKLPALNEFFETIETPNELKREVERAAATKKAEEAETHKNLHFLAGSIEGYRTVDVGKLIKEAEELMRTINVERLKSGYAAQIDNFFTFYGRYRKQLGELLETLVARKILASDTALRNRLKEAFSRLQEDLDYLIKKGLVKDGKVAYYRTILKPVSFTPDFKLAA